MPYMVTFAITIPPMLAYIPYMDPMGYGKFCIWIRNSSLWKYHLDSTYIFQKFWDWLSFAGHFRNPPRLNSCSSAPIRIRDRTCCKTRHFPISSHWKCLLRGQLVNDSVILNGWSTIMIMDDYHSLSFIIIIIHYYLPLSNPTYR